MKQYLLKTCICTCCLLMMCMMIVACVINSDSPSEELEIEDTEQTTQDQTNESNKTEDIEMNELEKVLYDKVKSEILSWDEDEIYAISFFVYSNEAFEYKNYENVSMWAISYNTEDDCNGAGALDEERWNYAFWRQDEIPIIDIDNPNEYTEMLYNWYSANGITNIGEENEDNDYDEDYNYIGKGPVGHYELVCIASKVARNLQADNVIKEHFGKPIPIIVHGLEYAWFDIEATKNANPNGEADVFLRAMKDMGFF